MDDIVSQYAKEYAKSTLPSLAESFCIMDKLNRRFAWYAGAMILGLGIVLLFWSLALFEVYLILSIIPIYKLYILNKKLNVESKKMVEAFEKFRDSIKNEKD